MRRFSRFFRQNSQTIILLAGLVIVLGGIIFAIWPHPHYYTANVLISVGSSMMAAAITSWFSPLNDEVFQRFAKSGIHDFYPSRRDVENRKWCDWLRHARERCTLIGIAHYEWSRDEEFEPALTQALRNKVLVKVFFLNPNSGMAQLRAREDTRRDTLQIIKTTINTMWEIRERLDPEIRGNFQLFVYDATPTGTTWIDELMVVTHYLPSFANLTSPALLLVPGRGSDGSRSSYAVYAENARQIELQKSTRIDEGNIDDFRAVQRHDAPAL